MKFQLFFGALFLCLLPGRCHKSHFRKLLRQLDQVKGEMRTEANTLRRELQTIARQFAAKSKGRNEGGGKGAENLLASFLHVMAGFDKRIATLNTERDLFETKIELWMHSIEDKLEAVENRTRETRLKDVEAPLKPIKTPTDCQEVYEHGGLKFEGDYHIMIKPEAAPDPFKVVCRSFNNSGWTVIQRRQDGSVDFYRNWDAYKEGFGDRHTEFWLGNDKIHYLTSQGDMMLRIDMQDWDNKNYMATYDHFSVDDESKLYRLHVSGYHGNSGDSLTSHWESHDGMAFSTKDKDNDGRYYDSCAHHYHGAWWFNNCFDSHLNGKYYTKGFHRNYFQRDGIQWNSIHQYSSLKHVEIMIKPADRPKPTPRISNDV